MGILPVANMIIQTGPNNIPHTLSFYKQTNFPDRFKINKNSI